MQMLSMAIRIWFVRWAYASEFDADAEHTRQNLIWMHMHKNSIFEMVPSKHSEYMHQNLMHTLSIRIRIWCICWACTPEFNAYPEHTGQNLMHALSIHVRIWCMPWAYNSESDVSDTKWCLAPPKISRESDTKFWTSSFFHQSVFPRNLSVPLGPFQIFSKIQNPKFKMFISGVNGEFLRYKLFTYFVGSLFECTLHL